VALTYSIDSVRRVVFIRGSGVVSSGQLRQCTQVLLSDPRFDPVYGRLADFREVTQWAVVGGSVREAGDTLARRATIVTGELAFGLGRMSQLSADSPPDLSLVCRDLPSALAWLGLDPTSELAATKRWKRSLSM